MFDLSSTNEMQMGQSSNLWIISSGKCNALCTAQLSTCTR